MRITPRTQFRYAGELPPRFDSKDPRGDAFAESQVVVDLRECEFVRAGAVFWCLVYPLLAKLRGSECRLLVPTNTGVCIYLKSMGLFRVLQNSGIEADDRGIYSKKDSQLVLPLTRFDTESEVEELTNETYESLQRSGLGSANLYPLVSEVFAELAVNAVEYADSPIGAYGFVQFYEFEVGRRFVCGIADSGIGIRRSLVKNPELRERVFYDWDAIELASRERVRRYLQKVCKQSGGVPSL